MCDDETLVNSFSDGVGARRHRHRARRERRPRLQAAGRDLQARHHRPRRPPAVAPARGRGRGREPRDPHRGSAEGADLPRARLLAPGARGDRARAQRRPARVRRGARRAPADRRLRLPRSGFHARRGARDEPAVPLAGAPGRRCGAACSPATCRPPPRITARSARSRRRRARTTSARSRTAPPASRTAWRCCGITA